MNNQSISKKSLKHVWHPCSQMKHFENNPLIPIKKAKGVWLYDFDGKRYLDGISSWWVNLFGHNHPKIKAEIKKQMNQLEHTMIAGLTHEPVVNLSAKLNQLTKLGHCFYGSDGANAIEIAIKMSTHYWLLKSQPKKNKIVYLKNSYHGETLGALSVTSVPLFQRNYQQLLRSHIQVDSPDWRFKKHDQSEEEYTEEKLNELKRVFEKKSPMISAIIIEPMVQCAGGMGMYSPNYLIGLRKLCDDYEIHLIADEVAVGFGRTGKMFAVEHANIKPDFICLSKGITGGFLPLSVTLTSNDIFNAFYDDEISHGFLHSHSYSGNPLACSAALATLSIFTDEKIISQNKIKSKKLTVLLNEIKHLPLHNFRHLGMIWAFELDKRIHIENFTKNCLDHGLFIRPLGQTVYLMPPYCISDHEMQFMVKIIKKAIEHEIR